MKLYLHIGTEKTGSSYVQTLLSKNRTQLESHGYYFPGAGKHEQQMLAGKISAGNGVELKNTLCKPKENLEKLLLDYIKKAKEKSCDKIVISNENLIESLSDAKVLKQLVNSCKVLNLEIGEVLLVLRDPIDQALSLYKHRAKNGNIAIIDKWLKTGYDLPIYLKGFLENISRESLKITVRKFKKEKLFLENVFFNDWLKVGNPVVSHIKPVNPSLTLSELYFLKELRKADPYLVKKAYQAFLSMEITEKKKDKQLEKAYRMVISNHLEGYNRVWLNMNDFLQENEKIDIPISFNKGQDNFEDALEYTPKQVQVMTSLIADSKKIKVKVDRMLYSIKQFIIGVTPRPFLDFYIKIKYSA
ncbi:hypothetical protein [Mangrovimonas aestuarii]|uniref:hypothetical protein n=1 Tax=Mangrovimonas aestuarii TaxID=3018443 RepID=UPI002378CDD5|nr:hypothetical protein [Mangrovimonas aestuarii]